MTKINRTNAVGTCLWCGKRLQPDRYAPETNGLPNEGHLNLGFFCTKICGWRFGIVAAKNNFRLAPYKEN